MLVLARNAGAGGGAGVRAGARAGTHPEPGARTALLPVPMQGLTLMPVLLVPVLARVLVLLVLVLVLVQGCIRRQRGGGGVWDPKICAPKMARPVSPFVNSFLPTAVTLVCWWDGGGEAPPGCQPF